ncbi:MAG TPA: prephenate dehydratase [Acidobacteriota bacterium]
MKTGMQTAVAIQGERGSFSEQAAEKLFGSRINLICCPSFDDLFAAMKRREARFAVVPIENTLAGSIHKNYDLLLESGLEIVAETNIRIEHCLIGTGDAKLDRIETVLSHPVALDQCRQFFKEHRRMKEQETYDTAGAVQNVIRDGDRRIAAIASLAAARHFGGKVLAKNIEDNPENFTRFFALHKSTGALSWSGGPRRKKRGQGYRRAVRRKTVRNGSESVKTSLVFITKNIPGALFRCLSVFALRDINLSKIESRPLPGRPWEYLFYVDLSAALNEERTRNALRHLEEITEFLKVLGCYSTVGEREKR